MSYLSHPQSILAKASDGKSVQALKIFSLVKILSNMYPQVFVQGNEKTGVYEIFLNISVWRWLQFYWHYFSYKKIVEDHLEIEVKFFRRKKR